jgi:hypothetical protein
MNPIAVIGRVVVSVAVLAALVGVVVGVLAGSRDPSPDSVIQCTPGADTVGSGCPSAIPVAR